MASCPDCGSENAVSKAEAWDALCEIPPKTKKEMSRLIRISNAAAYIANEGHHPGDENTVVTTIRVDFLEALQDAFK